MDEITTDGPAKIPEAENKHDNPEHEENSEAEKIITDTGKLNDQSIIKGFITSRETLKKASPEIIFQDKKN